MKAKVVRFAARFPSPVKSSGPTVVKQKSVVTVEIEADDRGSLELCRWTSIALTLLAVFWVLVEHELALEGL